MTTGNSRYLIGLITLALIGSIALQVWLFSNALEVRRARFKSDVLDAMRNAGEQIEGVDAMRLLDSETNFRPWLTEQIPEVFSVVDSAQQFDIEAAQDQLLLSQSSALEEDLADSGSFYTFRYEADTTYFAPGGPLRVEVSQEGAGRRSVDGKIRLYLGQMQRVEERVLTMDTVLQTFVRSSVRDWVPIDSRFENELIDSIIRAELEHKGVGAEYQYAVQEGDYLTALKSEGFDEEASRSNYKVPIFRSDLWGSPRFLLLQMPGREAYIYGEMWMMFALSILFTLGVIVTFWSTIRQMLRQKKINSIKNDFINNMTHEFKTPLATINLAIDALNSPKLSEDIEKRKHYTNIIKKENERMHKQVEHVLQMSLLDKGDIQLKKEVTPLLHVVEDACTHMSLTIEGREGEINTEVPEDVKVLLDSHHFTNVLINILDNAVKYSVNAPEISVRAEVEGNKVQLYIQDNGIGMSKDVREHIFDRFYRAERGNVHTVKGHGLGLAYAKEIIDMHNGEIRVKSSVGQGSTFIITLALA